MCDDFIMKKVQKKFYRFNSIYSSITLYTLNYLKKQKKGIWWMPWCWKAMKDVIDCDKSRVVVNKL